MAEQKHGGPTIEERHLREARDAMTDMIDNQVERTPSTGSRWGSADMTEQGRLRRMRARLRSGNIFRVFAKRHRSTPWLLQGNNLLLVGVVVVIGLLVYLSAPG